MYLLEHRDRIVPKHELCAQVWPKQFISDVTRCSTVRAVRQAIGDTGEAHQLIRDGPWVWLSLPGPSHGPHGAASGGGPDGGRAGEPSTPPLLVLEAEAAGSPTLQTIPPSVSHPVLSPGERKVVTVLCCGPGHPRRRPCIRRPRCPL